MISRMLKLGVLACAFAGLWLTVMPDASIAAPPSSKGTITGTVTLDGAPWDGVKVRLYVAGATNYLAQTTADGNGQYEFKRVAPGDYEVKAFNPPSLVCHGETDATVVAGQTTVADIAAICEIFPP